MIEISEPNWRPLLERLADELTPEPLAEPAWDRAFRQVPRHVFVPGFYADQEEGEPVWIDTEDERWLPGVYSDDALTTQLRQHPQAPGLWWPTSSSSRPSLMLAMLHSLTVGEGDRVLELGTGSGYNAALLCARLSEDQVVTVDIDPELTRTAGERLTRAGFRPEIATADGTGGVPGRQLFERVIATHSVERVPHAWVARTRPGGIILADIRSVGAPRIGHLARLVVGEDGIAEGGFDVGEPGYFMPTRLEVETPQRRFPAPMDLRDAVERRSAIGPKDVADDGAMMGLWAAVPEIGVSRMGERLLLFTPDGSWARADGDGEIDAAGPRDLWAAAEHAHEQWVAAGRPGIADYRVRVGPWGQDISVP